MKRSAGLLAAALLLLACGSKKLDLAPLANTAGASLSGICRLDEERLVVTIANRGPDHSLSSTTIVRFDDGPETVLPTQPVPPGETVEVSAVLPRTCLDDDGCSFTITADGRYDIPETNEDNNVYQGTCRP